MFFAASRQSLARELNLLLDELTASDLAAGEMVRGGLTVEAAIDGGSRAFWRP